MNRRQAFGRLFGVPLALAGAGTLARSDQAIASSPPAKLPRRRESLPRSGRTVALDPKNVRHDGLHVRNDGEIETFCIEAMYVPFKDDLTLPEPFDVVTLKAHGVDFAGVVTLSEFTYSITSLSKLVIRGEVLHFRR